MKPTLIMIVTGLLWIHLAASYTSVDGFKLELYNLSTPDFIV